MLTLLKFSDYPLYWYLKHIVFDNENSPPAVLVIFFFVIYFMMGAYILYKKIKTKNIIDTKFEETWVFVFYTFTLILFAIGLTMFIHFHIFHN